MLEVICGPMFAGKSTALAERYYALQAKGAKVKMFTSSADTRPYRRHDRGAFPEAEPVNKNPESDTGIQLGAGFDAVMFDEAQFMPEWVCGALGAILRAGKLVTVAGLDRDSEGASWPVMLRLVGMSQNVTFLEATCGCGRPAHYTLRLSPKASTIAIGGAEAYAPACKKCWETRT